jgi:hypothetical protein
MTSRSARKVRELLSNDPRVGLPVARDGARPPVGPWERQLSMFDPVPSRGTKEDARAEKISSALARRAAQVFDFVRRCGPMV